MDEFTGVMAIGTGWVAILMPVLIVWVIFYYSTKMDKDKYAAMIEISKNLEDPSDIEDLLENFKEKNTIILGMSADSVKSQKNFCEKQKFPFQLVSDPDKSTIRKYEAIGMKKMYGREYEGIFRISYLINTDGVIQKADGKVNPKDHAKEVLNDLG